MIKHQLVLLYKWLKLHNAILHTTLIFPAQYKNRPGRTPRWQTILDKDLVNTMQQDYLIPMRLDVILCRVSYIATFNMLYNL